MSKKYCYLFTEGNAKMRELLGGKGKALGHGQTDIGHLRQIGALTAQQLTHLCVAFSEQVAVLFAHLHILHITKKYLNFQ